MRYYLPYMAIILLLPLFGMERAPAWGTEEWRKARAEVEDTVRTVERREREKERKRRAAERILRERVALAMQIKESRRSYDRSNSRDSRPSE